MRGQETPNAMASEAILLLGTLGSRFEGVALDKQQTSPRPQWQNKQKMIADFRGASQKMMKEELHCHSS